ncbi:MAG TPA: glutathione binding-like protein [Nevskiaceae bacterium]|nr:glutathione binding-like protein [Nevskiaceae bacterium]
MKLFFSPGTCSMATWISLEWTGKPYETHQVNIHGTKSPELVAHNPMGALPTLEDDGWWLTQNVAVLNYVADKYPEAKLHGDGSPRARAEVNRWLGFVNSDMHAVFKAYFGGSDYLGDAAMIAKSKANAGELLKQRFDIIDKHLAGREWLAASQHTVVDAYLYVLTNWAAYVKIDLGGMKNLQAFIARMKADPAVKRVAAAEAKAAG